jgi:hypothetical protein
MSNENEPFSSIVGPAQTNPVAYEGVKYEAPIGRMSYVVSSDEKTGEKLWEKKIYETKIIPDLEEDVQWVFIVDLKIKEENGRVFLFVTNSNGEIFKADITEKTKIPSVIKC